MLSVLQLGALFRSFAFLYEFLINLSIFPKKHSRILIGVILNLQINLGRIDIFTVVQTVLTQQAWDCCPWKGPLAKLAAGWYLGTWIWGDFPSSPELGRVALCAWTVCTVRGMLSTCFPSGGLQVWSVPGGGCLHEQRPADTLGAESLKNLWQPRVTTRCWRS